MLPDLPPYLSLTGDLLNCRFPEEDLSQHAQTLPPLTAELLDAIVAKADRVSLAQPKHGWALTAVAAAAQTTDLRLRGLSAWQLARAANGWVRPRRVEAAIEQAQVVYAALQDDGWLAACDWQYNAIPWMRSNLQMCAESLANALPRLQQAGLTRFVPDCRLSLVLCLMIKGAFDEALVELDTAEGEAAATADPFGRWRWLLTKISYLRRRSGFAAAHTLLEEAYQLAQRHPAPTYEAQTHFQYAYITWLHHGNFHEAEAEFKTAAQLYEAADLPLRLAQCYNGLAQIYTNSGRLMETGAMLEKARVIYEGANVPSLLTDNLLDNGRFAMYCGIYKLGLTYLDNAKKLSKDIDHKNLLPIIVMNEADIYSLLNYYQKALSLLDEVHHQLQHLRISHRLIECEMRLTHNWLALGNIQDAFAFSSHVIDHCLTLGQTDYLVEAYNLQASIFLAEYDWDNALLSLKKTLDLAYQQRIQPEIGRAHRQLAEVYDAKGRPDKMVEHLEAATAIFQKIEMPVEVAMCYIIWGRYFAQTTQAQLAKEAYQKAFDWSQETVPQIAWQASAGLASLASGTNNHSLALEHYQVMIKMLNQIRHYLWQPNLVEGFLHRPVRILHRAVSFAAQIADPGNALSFIEASKAQLANLQVIERAFLAETLPNNQQLSSLAAEIRWCQEQLYVYVGQSSQWLRSVGELQLRQQLQQKLQAYHKLRNQLERQQMDIDESAISIAAFELVQFRQIAIEKLNHNWVAVTYYLADEVLVFVVVTPTNCITWDYKLPELWLRQKMMLEQGADLTLSDYQQLGKWLLPARIQKELTPNTMLILAPHRHLHRLPWNMMVCSLTGKPLMANCVPVVVPSLHSLMLLWQRHKARYPISSRGLFVGVADFPAKHDPLPAALTEIEALQTSLKITTSPLLGADATQARLRQLAQEDDWHAYDLLHLATHAFYDPYTGRCSGLALADTDIWLDDLAELAPLPPLVTLSACSGLQSLVYEGDEQVGLAATCLAAGAQAVVGSLWPVPDGATTQLMVDFYQRWEKGIGVAEALATAQRLAWRRGERWQDWGGFACMGQP